MHRGDRRDQSARNSSDRLRSRSAESGKNPLHDSEPIVPFPSRTKTRSDANRRMSLDITEAKNTYALYDNLTGMERELAILGASWHSAFGTLPFVAAGAGFMLPVVDLFVLKPLLLLFFFGKWMTGHGGSGVYEICARSSGHPVSFWQHDEASRQRCQEAVMTEFASYLTTIMVPAYFVLLLLLMRQLLRGMRKLVRKLLPRPVRNFWRDTPVRCPQCARTGIAHET